MLRGGGGRALVEMDFWHFTIATVSVSVKRKRLFRLDGSEVDIDDYIFPLFFAEITACCLSVGFGLVKQDGK